MCGIYFFNHSVYPKKTLELKKSRERKDCRYEENKFKTTIQELMFLFKEMSDVSKEFPIYGNLKIL